MDNVNRLDWANDETTSRKPIGSEDQIRMANEQRHLACDHLPLLHDTLRFRGFDRAFGEMGGGRGRA